MMEFNSRLKVAIAVPPVYGSARRVDSLDDSSTSRPNTRILQCYPPIDSQPTKSL
jgi:hypothetical protein